MTKKPEIYIAIDIETDGPIPGRNSMLSLAAVPVWLGGVQEHEAFSMNLKPLTEAVQDERTMTEFWAKNPEAWAEVARDPVDPVEGMRAFYEWLLAFDRPTIAVCWPAGFDFTFVTWYMQALLGTLKPLGFSCLDMRSIWFGLAPDKTYKKLGKRALPQAWRTNRPHTHKALDDALELADIFRAMLQHRRQVGEAARHLRTALDTIWPTK